MADKKKPAPAQGMLVPYVWDNREPIKRGKQINRNPNFRIGQRSPTAANAHATGGPANAGGKSDFNTGLPFNQSQPSWRSEFDNDFYGVAAPPDSPDLSGIPSNNFRGLGDNFRGRQ
jgi:hypothetical protein